MRVAAKKRVNDARSPVRPFLSRSDFNRAKRPIVLPRPFAQHFARSIVQSPFFPFFPLFAFFARSRVGLLVQTLKSLQI